MKFYKHDIMDWMNGTESLSCGAYRLYHVICQLIYLNEGPIKYHERGLAGRCNMRLQDVRRCLKELQTEGKVISLEDHLDVKRCSFELHSVAIRRSSISQGVTKALKNKKAGEVQPPIREDKTKTRQDYKDIPPNGGRSQNGKTMCPADWQPHEQVLAPLAAQGFNEAQISAARDEMVDWSIGKGEKRSDWDACFRNWLRRNGTRTNVAAAALPRLRAQFDAAEKEISGGC